MAVELAEAMAVGKVGARAAMRVEAAMETASLAEAVERVAVGSVVAERAAVASAAVGWARAAVGLLAAVA